jgi:hypothetical protein
MNRSRGSRHCKRGLRPATAAARRDHRDAGRATNLRRQQFTRKAIESQVRDELKTWRALLTDDDGTGVRRRQLLREMLAGPLTFT